jgi:hypothetical protein
MVEERRESIKSVAARREQIRHRPDAYFIDFPLGDRGDCQLLPAFKLRNELS